MLRHLFTVASAISLLLFMAAAVLYLRGTRYPDSKEVVISGRWFYVFSGRGHLAFATQRQLPALSGMSGGGAWSRDYYFLPQARVGVQDVVSATGYQPLVLTDTWGRRLRFPRAELRNYAVVAHSTRRILDIHFGYLVAVTATMPLIWAVRNRSFFGRRRDGEARCLRCGYDLRASAGRCPECGTLIPSTATPAEESTISN